MSPASTHHADNFRRVVFDFLRVLDLASGNVGFLATMARVSFLTLSDTVSDKVFLPARAFFASVLACSCSARA
jgi:hypothetical protein